MASTPAADSGGTTDAPDSGRGGGILDSLMAFVMTPLGAGVGIGLLIALGLGWYIL